MLFYDRSYDVLSINTNRINPEDATVQIAEVSQANLSLPEVQISRPHSPVIDEKFINQLAEMANKRGMELINGIPGIYLCCLNI